MRRLYKSFPAVVVLLLTIFTPSTEVCADQVSSVRNGFVNHFFGDFGDDSNFSEWSLQGSGFAHSGSVVETGSFELPCSSFPWCKAGDVIDLTFGVYGELSPYYPESTDKNVKLANSPAFRRLRQQH